MNVGDICIRDVVFTTGDHTVREAAALMERHHVGDLVVVDRDGPGELEPLGIVTDRDLVTKVLAQHGDPDKVRVAELMADPLVTALEREDPAAVLERMKSFGVRRVPVVGEGGELVGILTYDDLVGWLGEELGELSEVVARGLRRERGEPGNARPRTAGSIANERQTAQGASAIRSSMERLRREHDALAARVHVLEERVRSLSAELTSDEIERYERVEQ